MNTKRLTKLIALVLVMVMALSMFAACQKKQGDNKGGNDVTTNNGGDVTTSNGGVTPEPPVVDDGKYYTYNTYTGVSPSNWNELTYQDNNDTQVMGYIGSAFFNFDFKFDANGEIIPGEFSIVYEAATKLEDVTAEYADAWGLDADSKGFAYRITLRNDLAWENGDKITAHDFVYTMSEQLSPLFLNYRADSFYGGATVLVNAMQYVMQGQSKALLDNGAEPMIKLEDLVKDANGVYKRADGGEVYLSMCDPLAYLSGKTVESYAKYLDADAYDALEALANDDGRVEITDETLALWAQLICTEDWGFEDPSYIPEYIVAPNFTYPAMDFSEVGILAESDTELVIVLEQALPLLKEDGSLSYQAAYNMSSLPLVHKATYEANKVAPAIEGGLWTSTYNSSVASTMSWGPYKLTEFQGGKVYVMERNDKWFGYGMPENEGLYLADKIYCETIGEWNTAWLKFLAGEIDGIGIDVSVAADYKGSSQAYFTPDDYVGSLQLQSNRAALEAREEEGINKTMLAYADFRKALSLSVDRVAYTQACTTASFAGFGLFNSMHYYDVENGGVFRNSDEAKKVLCEVYAVDWTNTELYPTLDDAVEAVTGYNLAEARALLTKAYNEALAAGDIDADDKVVLTFGTSVINEATQRNTNFIGNAFIEMAVGTPLEGRIEFELKDFGQTWANSFRAGAYDVCQGGWTGAAWDPGYFLLAYLHPNYMYSQAWATNKHMMEFTMVGVGPNGEDITENYDLLTWYACLNGSPSAPHDWSANALPQELRLQLIARLEKEVLLQYYTVPLLNNFSASLISYKCDYITYEYNTFMGYGGIKYMQFNYTDAEWEEQIQINNGHFDYTK